MAGELQTRTLRAIGVENVARLLPARPAENPGFPKQSQKEARNPRTKPDQTAESRNEARSNRGIPKQSQIKPRNPETKPDRAPDSRNEARFYCWLHQQWYPDRRFRDDSM